MSGTARVVEVAKTGQTVVEIGGGTPGRSILSGDGPPAVDFGRVGDFYIDKTNHELYGPKVDGIPPSWGGAPASLTGPAGPAGADGAPGPAGADGAQGPQGPAGADGAAGTDGLSVLSGTGAPADTLGVDGEHYIDTDSSTLYGPKAGGTWPAGVSLIGPQGPQGPAGADGISASVMNGGIGYAVEVGYSHSGNTLEIPFEKDYDAERGDTIVYFLVHGGALQSYSLQWRHEATIQHPTATGPEFIDLFSRVVDDDYLNGTAGAGGTLGSATIGPDNSSSGWTCASHQFTVHGTAELKVATQTATNAQQINLPQHQVPRDAAAYMLSVLAHDPSGFIGDGPGFSVDNPDMTLISDGWYDAHGWITDFSGVYSGQEWMPASVLSLGWGAAPQTGNILVMSVVAVRSGGSKGRSVRTITSDYTMVAEDVNRIIEADSASAVTVTIPAGLAAELGAELEVVQIGAGAVTIAPDVGVTLESAVTPATLSGQYGRAIVRKRSTDLWIAHV